MKREKTPLEVEMYEKGVSRYDLCDTLGITYPALHEKIVGHTDFKRGEMFKIKARLGSTKTLDELFS